MFLITAFCDFKCCKELNLDISMCQNHNLVLNKHKPFLIEDIIKSYMSNDITKAVVIGGLEPFLQYNELYSFISELRKSTDDDIVIYTGYNKEEIEEKITELKDFKNIIIKFGRYNPFLPSTFDTVLGITLFSSNQYAEKIS